MLRIRSEQMKVLSQRAETNFVEEMAAHLRDDFPDAVATHGLQPEDLQVMVRRGIDEAGQYGIVNEPDLESYIEFMVVLSPTFHSDSEFAWVQEVLTREDLDGEEKMKEIDQRLLFSDDPR